MQSSGPPGIGLRPLSSPNSASGMGYDQLQQHQQHHGQSQFRLQHMSGVSQSFRDQGMKSLQAAQSSPDPFGLLGLLSVIRLSDPDLASLALGIDLTTLGLNLNSADNLHKTFGSPWSDEPAKGDPDFNVPQCYVIKPPASLHVSLFHLSYPSLSSHVKLANLLIFLATAARVFLKIYSGDAVLYIFQVW